MTRRHMAWHAGLVWILTCLWLGMGGGVSLAAGQDAAPPVPAAAPIRVACVGDSITQGVHVRGEDNYPATLGKLLGGRYQVRNFGFLGGSVMNVPDRPYSACPEFKEATAFNPDIVIFMLGTNDSKPDQWKHKERFKPDLLALLDHFAGLPAKPRIWLCTPAWVAKHYPGGHDEQVIGGEIVPVIRAVAVERKLPLIDIHAEFDGRPELFVDGIHPNAAGCAVLAQAVFGKLSPQPACSESVLFAEGRDGYRAYRIPALLVTARNTVLAFCEGRKNGFGDHGDIDIVMKRSTDAGRTWSAQEIVQEEGGEAKITIGNPCLVQDAATGTVWLAFTRDNKAVLVSSSDDDGKTWSKPRDISHEVMLPGWTWVATGPGIGIQLTGGGHKGRLVIPCDHSARTTDGKTIWGSHMMFSDDAGSTWQISAPIQPGANECQVIQRNDGSLLVNTRMQDRYEGFRGIATSGDGGATWSALAQDRQLPCPKCQASLLRFSETQLLFSNPDPTPPAGGKPEGRRVNLTIRLSADDGGTWPVARLLHKGPAAYSSLGRLGDGTLLCLYEGGDKNPNETIRLARFNIEWLTQSAPH